MRLIITSLGELSLLTILSFGWRRFCRLGRAILRLCRIITFVCESMERHVIEKEKKELYDSYGGSAGVDIHTVSSRWREKEKTFVSEFQTCT